MAMKRELRDKWLAALRSGKYEQCTEKLYDGHGYCCLGVLAKVAGLTIQEGCTDGGDTVDGIGADLEEAAENEYNPLNALAYADNSISPCTESPYTYYIKMNDGGLSFKAIADAIKKTLPVED